MSLKKEKDEVVSIRIRIRIRKNPKRRSSHRSRVGSSYGGGT